MPVRPRVPALLVAAVALALIGAPAANAARAWMAPVTLSTPGSQASMVDGAVTSAGTAVMAWTESRSPELPELLIAERRPGGAPSSPSPLAQKAFGPTVATDGQGNALVAWEYEPPVGGFQVRQRILVATRHPDGSVTGPEDVGQGQGGIGLAANARGDAAIIWTQYRYPRRQVVGAVKPAGAPWSPPEVLSGIIDSPYINDLVDVAVTPSGEAVFVWQEPVDRGDDVSTVQTTFRPVIGVAPPSTTLSSPGTRAFFPRIAADGSGRVVAVWKELDGNGATTVRGAFRSPAGLWGSPATIAGMQADTNDYEGFDLAASDAGDVALTWMERTVYSWLATGSTASESFAAPIQLGAGSGGAPPQVALERSGGGFAAYYNDVTTTTRRLSPGGAVDTPVAVCPGESGRITAVGIDTTATAAVLVRRAQFVGGPTPQGGELRYAEDAEAAQPGPPRCNAGTPFPPRPPRPAPPKVEVGSKTIVDFRSAEKRGVPLRLRCPSSARVVVKLTADRELGRTVVNLTGGKTLAFRLPLTAKARKRLATTRVVRAKLQVFRGTVVVGSANITLRRAKR